MVHILSQGQLQWELMLVFKKNTMKKLYILAIVVLMGCGDEFLDLQPESVADIKDIYRTESDFEQALMGAYDELQSSGQYGRNFQFLFDTRGNIVGESSAGFQDGIYYEIDRFLIRAENPLLQQSWASLYTSIYRANIILEKLAVSNLSSSMKETLGAEARFIRALSYFNIIRIWGDAPLITKTISPDEALKVSRNAQSNIYEFIGFDLEAISQVLPVSYDDTNTGRATKNAALALLGKIKLEQGDYSSAASALKSVIDTDIYKLQDDFNDIFPIQNEWNDEIIFAIRWKRQVEETNLFFGRATLPITINQDFLDSFEPSDARLTASSLGNVGSYTIPMKFRDAAGSDGKTGMDFPVLRYADVLLMYAEAINEQSYQSSGPAFNALNEVRSRAGLAELTDVSVSDQSAFRSALFAERKKEFIYEGSSWFDSIRLGDAVLEVSNDLGITISEAHFVYPIPQSEINRVNNTNFQQNEAYK